MAGRCEMIEEEEVEEREDILEVKVLVPETSSVINQDSKHQHRNSEIDGNPQQPIAKATQNKNKRGIVIWKQVSKASMDRKSKILGSNGNIFSSFNQVCISLALAFLWLIS